MHLALLIIVTISVSDKCKMESVAAASQELTQVACDTLLRKTQSKYQVTHNVHFVYFYIYLKVQGAIKAQTLPTDTHF